ncbi:MAG: CocE/NonD family hydrolase [Candidatus Dormibacteraceae bacterium]
MLPDQHPLGPAGRFAGAALAQIWGLPPARTMALVERDLPVEMRDGAVLLADHYAPAGLPERPTVLLRTPYGRGFLAAGMVGEVLAARGYHVLAVSSRGTFGSAGRFQPMRTEARDGQDVVAWLRRQTWFDGRLATWGPSYLGFTQWALASDPPPELRAMIVAVGLHDIPQAGRGHGPLELLNLLTWADVVAHQERLNPFLATARTLLAEQRLGPLLRQLPLDTASARLGGDPLPFYREWVDNEQPDDPYWDQGYRMGEALQRVQVPTLLVGGWYDWFIDQTLEQYTTLRRRGVPIRLVVGPWTHIQVNQQILLTETLAWLDAQVTGQGSPPPRAPVRIFVTGADSWLDTADWPGSRVRAEPWYLGSGGRLTPEAPDLEEGSSTFRYDPSDPTPSVGGRTMLPSGGPQINTSLEARPDVLTFSTAPLEGPLELRGQPQAILQMAVDNPAVDVFCRLCDVDRDGVSWNVSDRILRRNGSVGEVGRVETVHISLDPLAHRFLPRHRIRLQISGGAFPRYARNLGTGDPEASGEAMRVSRQTVYFDRDHPSSISLPVVRLE